MFSTDPSPDLPTDPFVRGASQAHRHGALSLRFAPCPEANPPLPSHGEARAVSPRLGGPMRTEPLDHESAAATGQPGFNHENACAGMVSPCCNAATRGESLSRDTRKPQNESVKKNLVIESCESTVESLRMFAARTLLVAGPMERNECFENCFRFPRQRARCWSS